FFRSKYLRLIKSIVPKLYWKEYKLVLNYSLSIFAYSLFAVTATQSRPLILSMFSEDGARIVAEYKIVEVFPIFIISLGGALSTILLPVASGIIGRNDNESKSRLAITGTLYSSILCCVLCIPVVLC